MPRGEHPNSRANLIVNSERTPKQREDQARKAGQKSGEVRAQNASLSADLKGRCTPDRLAKINERILSMAEKGNLKAYELVRDTIGEKPVNRQINENIDRSAEELNEYLGRQESPND